MSIFTNFTKRNLGEEFIGRRNELQRAEEWLFPQIEEEFPSFVICGLSRIGKTCLARKLFQRVINRYGKDAAVFIDTSKLFPQGHSSTRFWTWLAAETQKLSGCRQKESEPSASTAVEAFDHFIDILENKPNRLVFFLDEFDQCLHLSDLSDFLNFLRGLINGADEYRTQFVLISRRSPELIQSSTDGSTLPGTLQRIDLKSFCLSEFTELVNYFRQENFFLSESEAKEVWELTYGHPYLSNAILSEVRKIEAEDSERVLTAYARTSSVFESYFQELLSFFDEFPVEKRFQTNMVETWRDCLFFERLFGRMIPPETKTHLTRYGLSGTKANVPSVFDSFLRQAVSVSANWEELSRLEKRIRNYIDAALCSYYKTEDWFSNLNIHAPDVWASKDGKDVFLSTVLNWYLKDRKRNPELRNRPIDFCYFDDLAGLMCMEQHWHPDAIKQWKGFSTLFHGSKNECRELLSSIGDMRNPEAHSRDYPKDFQLRFLDAKRQLDQILNNRIY